MDLTKRLISAAVMIALLVAALLLGGWTLVALCEAVVILMVFDCSNAFKNGGFMPNRIVLLLASCVMLPAVYFYGLTGAFLLCLVALAFIAVCTILSKKPDFKTLLSSFFLLAYPLMPGALLLCFVCDDVKNNSELGKFVLVFAVLCACLSDTFAYFGGRLFGKRKLCPLISPKKTVAGSIASFVGGVVAGALGMLFLDVNIALLLTCGLVCGGFAQIGDLLASMLKRFCNIKDYGSYIPGHGGIMDRMDSIITCLIAVTVIFYLFGVVTL